MKRIIALALLVSALVAFGTGCDKIRDMTSNVKGGVSGEVLNPDGSPHGYVMVVLVDSKSGAEVQRQTAEDTGMFFFQGVKGGSYKIQVKGTSGGAIPSEEKEFSLAMGRTIKEDVHLTAPPSGDQQQGGS
jgi:hypothetical protein